MTPSAVSVTPSPARYAAGRRQGWRSQAARERIVIVRVGFASLQIAAAGAVRKAGLRARFLAKPVHLR